MKSFTVTKSYTKDHPLNKDNNTLDVTLICDLVYVDCKFKPVFVMHIKTNVGNRIVGTYPLNQNDIYRNKLLKYFPEYTYLLNWLHWNVDGPTKYKFVEDTLQIVQYKEKQAVKSKDFFVVEGIPLLYKLDSNLITYIKEHGLDKLKNTSVTQFKHPDNNPNIRTLYSIGDYANEWKNAPFETAIEAESFLHTINNHCVNIRTVITEFSDIQLPNIDKAKEYALLKRATMKNFTETNLKNRLKYLIKQFKKDMINIGLKV